MMMPITDHTVKQYSIRWAKNRERLELYDAA